MTKLFTLEKQCPASRARAGWLNLSGLRAPTPLFMPVGTQGAVKAVDPETLKKLNVRVVLGNAYHLYLRPGADLIRQFGGLRKFINWDGGILTDSGGYQIFSLKDLRGLFEEGVEFKSHIDGSKHFFSPEKVIEIQRDFGSDILMPLDECTGYPATHEIAKSSAELSLRWAARSKKAFENSSGLYGRSQYHFGIGQGGVFPDLRKMYIERMVEIGFDGYAIGGLSVGEPAEEMYQMTGLSTELLPEDKPRYLMGVGTPENIIEATALGVDMFDCVLPTRNARNGQLFTSRGKINIRNSKFRLSDDPIDEKIDSYASRSFSLGYLRHLFIANEILGLQLATQHNIAFYQWITKTAREKIVSDEFSEWKTRFLSEIKGIF